MEHVTLARNSVLSHWPRGQPAPKHWYTVPVGQFAVHGAPATTAELPPRDAALPDAVVPPVALLMPPVAEGLPPVVEVPPVVTELESPPVPSIGAPPDDESAFTEDPLAGALSAQAVAKTSALRKPYLESCMIVQLVRTVAQLHGSSHGGPLWHCVMASMVSAGCACVGICLTPSRACRDRRCAIQAVDRPIEQTLRLGGQAIIPGLACCAIHCGRTRRSQIVERAVMRIPWCPAFIVGTTVTQTQVDLATSANAGARLSGSGRRSDAAGCRYTTRLGRHLG